MVSFTQLAVALTLLPFSAIAAPFGSHAQHVNIVHRRATKACRRNTSTAVPASSAVRVTSSSSAPAATTSSVVVAEPTTSSAAPSKTASSAAPASTSSASSSSPSNVSLLAIFPVSIKNAISSWSTSSLVADRKPLNDATLNIYAGKNTQHKYVNAPDGSPAMQALYTKGSISPAHTDVVGGFSLYAKGLTDLSQGNEVTFSYSAYFESGFDFNLGGKMPGLYGGINDKVATTCSGGDHNPDCWSARLMWRQDGEGELYAYLPQTSGNAAAFSSVKPKTVSNDAYGSSVGRGSYKWATGKWTHVAQRIKLNDVGKNNGEIEVYADGVSVIKATGLMFRTSAESKVRGAQIQTFFGGHTDEWASPKTQHTWFKDFTAAVIG